MTLLKALLLMSFLTLITACGGGTPNPETTEPEITNPDTSNPDTEVTNPTDPETDPETNPETDPETVANYQASLAYKMATSEMSRHPNVFGSWDYQTGTVMRGFEELYKATGDQVILNYIKSTVDSVVTEQGSIRGYSESEYNIDEIKEGSTLLFLYEETGEEKYKIAADVIREQLNNHPRTNSGGFWHKKKYPNQMWLDGLYMAQPFYTHYSKLFDEANYDDIMLQLTLMEEKALDSDTGLLYHGWDESGAQSWADPITGLSPEFWGRSIGWYMMALVDVLDHMPAEYTDYRATLIDILQRQTVALEAFQDEDGVWWQVVDLVGQNNNWQESSATAMYVYAIAKGIRMGYLPTTHTSTAEKGWAGLTEVFTQESSNGTLTLTDTCEGTSVGTLSYYLNRGRLNNDTKGVGPFIMAGVEMELLGK